MVPVEEIETMSDSEIKTDALPQRLCSEIQLFDLCDLSSCKHKNGRFCTDPALIVRFEKISEDELRTPERYVSGEYDDEDAGEDDEGYDDDVTDDFDGGEDGDLDEES